jgi:hypothetical protein
MNLKLPAIFAKNQHLANLASYFVLAAMMVCIAITYTQLLRWVMRGLGEYQWNYLPFLALVIALEAIFTRPIARGLEGREKLVYHLAEWITFAIVIKLIYYGFHGFDQLLRDLPGWQENFLSFLNGEFLIAYFLVAVIWFLSRTSANNIEELNSEPEDVSWEIGKLQNNRVAIRRELVDRLLWVGVALVAVESILRGSVAALLGMEVAQGSVINIMVYFCLTLVLFSQTQYALLHGRWYWHQTPIAAVFSQRWIRYSLIFFGLLALVAFLLPTGYSLGLLETLNYLISTLLATIWFIMQLILLPLVWLLSLGGCARQPQEQPPDVAPTPSIPQIPPNAPPLPWLELLQSILFWGIFIAVITYAIVQFIRQNPQIFALLKNIRLFNWLGNLWQGLAGWLSGAGAQVASALQGARQRLFPQRNQNPLRQLRNWANFRQLSPRQQIVFYYLRLLERGGEHGLKRQSFQTPYQYAGTLQSNLPEVEEDISGMTETFLEARYSQHEIDTQKTSLVQRFWRNITRSLRRLHK